MWIFIFLQVRSGVPAIAFVSSLHVMLCASHFSASPLLRFHVVVISFLGISACHLVTSQISCFPQVNLSLLHRSSSQQVLKSLCHNVTSPDLLKSWCPWFTMSSFHFSPSPQVMMSMTHYVILSLLLISSSHWVLDSLSQYVTSPHLLISVSAWVWSQISTSLEVESPHLSYCNVLWQTEIWQTEKWDLRSDMIRSVNQLLAAALLRPPASTAAECNVPAATA